jgi:sugar O-acyltransferase (sialic acid O-acetyltransferase NeuD family)
MTRLAVVGCGELGQLLSYYALSLGNVALAGFFDDFAAAHSRVGLGTVLGNVSEVAPVYEGGEFDQLLIAVGYKHFEFRRRVFERFKGEIPFARIVHPASYVDPSVQVGEGASILPGCTLDRDVVVEDNVVLNIGCAIAHNTVLGAHSFISAGVNLAGNVLVGPSSFIGIGATVIDGIRLCEGTKIGGGAVVIRDTEDTEYHVGVPARAIRRGRRLG